jgi:hypothetical protein
MASAAIEGLRALPWEEFRARRLENGCAERAQHGRERS